MQEFIQSSLEYIEQNLKTDITADELAQMAGYSVGHYCRLFSRTMDSSVANYILKRRLDYALAEISAGQKAVGVVLKYGFDTYSGFYKAFIRMYGCSPKKYLSIYRKSEVTIMHSEKDIQTILGNWDISKDLKIEDVSVGDWKTWKIGGEYYLKTNERSKMIRNIKIAKALKAEGLLSEFLPIPTKSGDDYLDGEHIFLLTRKIGEPPNNRVLSDDEIGRLENNELREKYAYKLGQAIARLHKALKSVQYDVNPYEANIYEQGEKSIPKIKQSPLEISENFFTDYIENFGVLYKKLPKQLIHGNLCGDMAVYENSEVVCIKSFEIHNVSHVRLFDITWSAGEINAQPYIDVYLKTLTEIAKGYDSISPLTAEEKQSIYYVICSTYMNEVGYFDETLDISSRVNKALVFLANNKEKFLNLI